MSRPKFKSGEKVLVPHTDKHYPAKVLKSEVRPDGTRHYLLHYTCILFVFDGKSVIWCEKGWNKKWDEWVTEAEIHPSASLKISLPKKREAVEKPKATPPPEKQQKTEIPEKPDVVPKPHRKRKADLTDKDAQLQLQLEIPPILKKQLLDEYDIVTSSQKTVTLPRKPNAMQILRQFYEYGKKELRCTNSELQMLITGLEEYIDKTLEDFLLYEIEWKQAARLLSGGVSASSIYGAEHLLRLLVKLPELVPHTSATSQQAAALNARLSDFLDFLVIHRHTFFSNVKDYTEVSDY